MAWFDAVGAENLMRRRLSSSRSFAARTRWISRSAQAIGASMTRPAAGSVGHLFAADRTLPLQIDQDASALEAG